MIIQKSKSLFIFLFIYVLTLCNVSVAEAYNGATTSDMIEFDKDEIKFWLKKEKGMEITHFSRIDQIEITGVKNFDQTDLNIAYSSKNNKTINDTCTIVACTEMVCYYGDYLNEFKIDDSTTETFINIYDRCMQAGYTTYTNGTLKLGEGYCLTESFKLYSSKRGASSDWWDLQSNIDKCVENKYPMILDLRNHSVVVCGKIRYGVVYLEKYWDGFLWWGSEKTREKRVIEEFVIVCDGWGRNNKSVVYYPKITNFVSGFMQVTWATEGDK